MITVSHIITASGVGDLMDSSFTVTGAYPKAYLVIVFHDGQGDTISSVLIDGAAMWTYAGGGSDGTTMSAVYYAPVSTGAHTFSIITTAGLLRYTAMIEEVVGQDDTTALTVVSNAGVSTSPSGTQTVRTPDNVLSVLTADTVVTATSSNTLLTSGLTTSGVPRVRYGLSYNTAGTIDWTLGSSQAWTLTTIRIRGTAFKVGTPITTGTPIYTGTPIRTGVPGNVLLNPQ